MYNLTTHIDTNNLHLMNELLCTLINLPYPTVPRYNEELNELTVLCELNHAADVEHILAPYV